MKTSHHETHRTHRTGWLRAAVLGANDGAISTASLVVGVASAGAAYGDIMLAGVAGLVSGALSMAAGEYVSVQSQADTEKADIAIEKRELEHEPERELAELTGIYIRRGLDEALARRVAEQLTVRDALGAHTRDELGITPASRARPIQGRAVFCGFVLGWRTRAARHGAAVAGRAGQSHCRRHDLHCVAGTRRDGRSSRRRFARQRRRARRLLGRARNGDHGVAWKSLR